MAFMKQPSIHNYPHPPCLSSHQSGLQDYGLSHLDITAPGGDALGEQPMDPSLILGTVSPVIPEQSRRKTPLDTFSRVTMDLQNLH